MQLKVNPLLVAILDEARSRRASLKQIGAPAHPAISTLEGLLKDSDERVRISAENAIREIKFNSSD